MEVCQQIQKIFVPELDHTCKSLTPKTINTLSLGLILCRCCLTRFINMRIKLQSFLSFHLQLRGVFRLGGIE
jgi:hypothetical protein